MSPLELAMKLYDAECEHRQQIETRASLYLVIVSSVGAAGAAMLFAMPDGDNFARRLAVSIMGGAAVPYAAALWRFLAVLRNDLYERLAEASRYIEFVRSETERIRVEESESLEAAREKAQQRFEEGLALNAAAAAAANLQRNVQRAEGLSASLRLLCAAIVLLSLAFGAFLVAEHEAEERIVRVKIVES